MRSPRPPPVITKSWIAAPVFVCTNVIRPHGAVAGVRRKPKSNSSTFTVVFCGFAHVPPDAVEPGLTPLDELVDDEDETAVVGCAFTFTPMPIWPFIPAVAWPGTVQMNVYVPLFCIWTVSVCDLPGLSRFVPLPVHELRT